MILNVTLLHLNLQSVLATQLCLTSVARQAPLSMKFPRQANWSGLLYSTSGDLPNPGIEPKSLVPPALAGEFFTTAPPGKPM